MNRFVYLDNNATTKISSFILEKIEPYLKNLYGNPSSIYQHGIKIKNKVEEARKHCSQFIGCNSSNIIFNSGGSEGNISAFNSAINKYPFKKKIITTKIEHSSILEYCKFLESKGYSITYLNIDENCNVDINQLKEEVDNNVCLISIQFANNEVGSVLLNEDVLSTIKSLKNSYEFDFHSDCVQGLGKLKIETQSIGADNLTFSGHKLHCPKGIGFMYVKDTKNFTPLIFGHQENGLRGGTENVLGIIALGESCKIISENFEKVTQNLLINHNYLESSIKKIKRVKINCENSKRVSTTTSLSFDNIEGNSLLLQLEKEGICVSTGSACNSVSSEPSHVLKAINCKYPENTIRISISNETTISEIDYFIEKLNKIIKGEKYASNN